MNNNSTKRPLLLTVLVIVFLLALHFLPKISIDGYEIRQIDILSDLTEKKAIHNDDGLSNKSQAGETLTKNAKGETITFKEVWPKGVQAIVDFSDGGANGLDHFYAMVDSVAHHKLKGRPLRVAYYGDSFIEGDILVSDLRELLQKKFGGNGVGWIDAANDLTQYKLTITNHFSGLAEHMAMKKDNYRAQQAGIAQRYYTMEGGSVKMTYDGRTDYPHTTKWGATRLYFTTTAGMSLQMTQGQNSQAQSFANDAHVQVAEAKGVTSHSAINVTSGNGILFGTALETDGGIIVDNFSLRGSAGNTIADLPLTMLSDFNRIRPYDLVILQFGTNAVTENSKEKQLQAYADQLKTVVQHLQKAFPNTSFLLVGAPDRGSKKSDTGTMESIVTLNEYQEQIAKECKIGFYSLYKGMGGAGTMRRLVDEHGWGSKDYVHVNYNGGKYIAEKFYRSLLAALDNYHRRMKTINANSTPSNNK